MATKVKTCNVCSRTSDEIEFKPNRNLCVDCYKDRQRGYYEGNKEAILAEERRKRTIYGTSLADAKKRERESNDSR
jgi:hypothetical protein